MIQRRALWLVWKRKNMAAAREAKLIGEGMGSPMAERDRSGQRRSTGGSYMVAGRRGAATARARARTTKCSAPLTLLLVFLLSGPTRRPSTLPSLDSSWLRLAAFDSFSRQLLISSENFQASVFNCTIMRTELMPVQFMVGVDTKCLQFLWVIGSTQQNSSNQLFGFHSKKEIQNEKKKQECGPIGYPLIIPRDKTLHFFLCVSY